MVVAPLVALARPRALPRASSFHVFLAVKQAERDTTPAVTELSDFDHGLLVGVLIGEASFGGDGKQPQVTLRMHVRHEALFAG